MNNEVFHGQSTKEVYRTDLEDSLKQKTVYKLYEFFDDYSYGKSTKIGFLIKKKGDKIYLILFMDDGPKTKEQLRKILEWRRSGDSHEIGHQGGGNKRNIYGHKSNQCDLIVKLDNENILYASTKPNKIYELSISDISEDNFRSNVDTSAYIVVPEEKEEEDMPTWYLRLYNNIKEEAEFEPNYIIRMELTEIPAEYSNRQKYNEMINQIRAKQYNIQICLKNELLDDDNYKTYNNIDLVGFLNKENEKKINVMYDIINDTFYIQTTIKNAPNVTNVTNGADGADGTEKSVLINVLNGKIEDIELSDNIIKWGHIIMFIVNESHFKEQNSTYNKDIEENIKAEDSYGVYLLLNDKLTNYKPFEGNHLPPGKNNGIEYKNPETNIIETKNTNRFRIIFVPENKIYFNKLIKTETIKSLTNFLEKAPYKKIIRIAMDIYRNKYVNKTKKTIKPKKKVDETNKPGGCYLCFLGYGVWKYGLVTNYNELSRRKNEHFNQSIEKVQLFSQKTMKYKNCTIYWNIKTNNPRGIEEKISKILKECNTDDRKFITLFEKANNSNEGREYFICNNHEYIIEDIIPKLEILVNTNP